MTALEDAPSEIATRSLTVIEAVREALREEMERDERAVVLGEDIGPLGGVFRATDGLLAQFGLQRVVDKPIMELGIAGLAVGMAMRGLRPVAEIQFADFMHAAADHIISDAARIRFRTNGDAGCPLVIRTAYGGAAYLDERGPFPHRLAQLELTSRFLTDFYALVGDWARWAGHIVETWPDEPGLAQPDLTVIEETVRRAAATAEVDAQRAIQPADTS